MYGTKLLTSASVCVWLGVSGLLVCGMTARQLAGG